MKIKVVNPLGRGLERAPFREILRKALIRIANGTPPLSVRAMSQSASVANNTGSRVGRILREFGIVQGSRGQSISVTEEGRDNAGELLSDFYATEILESQDGFSELPEAVLEKIAIKLRENEESIKTITQLRDFLSRAIEAPVE